MEFTCRDLEAKVRAANVRATLAAFELAPDTGDDIIARYGLPVGPVRPDAFIPVQAWLDALRDIQERVGADRVKAVGRAIIENAEFPPFADARSILLALDDIYQLNHRGDVGHYITRQLEDGGVEVRCETPYPRMFEWGLVEGICARRQTEDPFSIEYTPGPADAPDVTCILIVRPIRPSS